MTATVSTFSFGGTRGFPGAPESFSSPQLSLVAFGCTNTCCSIIYCPLEKKLVIFRPNKTPDRLIVVSSVYTPTPRLEFLHEYW